MALLFRSSSNATTGATPANQITIPKPADIGNGAVAAGDAMRAVICLRIGGGAEVATPPGWGLVTSAIDTSASAQMLIYERQAKSTDPDAGWTWVFNDARSAVGIIDAYFDDAGGFARFCHHAIGDTPSDVDHLSIELQSNVAGQTILIAYAAPVQDAWTNVITELNDVQTTEGTDDVCLSTAELALSGIGGSGNHVASLDSAVASTGITHSCLVTVAGMSQSAGTGSGIIVHDNTLMDNALYFNLAEIFASYAAECRVVHNSVLRLGYELNGFVIGVASSPQDTTWYERDKMLNTRTSFSTNASNLAYWTIDWERVFANHTLATTYRGNLRLIDCHIESAAALTIANGAASLIGVLQRTLLTHPSGGSGGLLIGSATFPLPTAEDLTIDWNVGSGADACTGFFADVARRIKFRTTDSRSFFGANTANAFDLEEVEYSGTPGTAHIRWGGSSANGWKFRGQRFIDGKDKFVVVSSGNPTLANASLVGDKFEFQYVAADGVTPLVGKRLKLTDELGNLVIDEVSDADGWITFGTGKDEQNVWLADFYAVALVETIRDRYHMTVEMNPVGDPSYDAALESIVKDWTWPTTGPITNNSGSFLPVRWVQPLGAPAAPAGPPSPVLVEEVPIAAPGEIRVQMAIPST